MGDLETSRPYSETDASSEQPSTWLALVFGIGGDDFADPNWGENQHTTKN